MEQIHYVVFDNYNKEMIYLPLIQIGELTS